MFTKYVTYKYLAYILFGPSCKTVVYAVQFVSKLNIINTF
jgi:hypothetical protein